MKLNLSLLAPYFSYRLELQRTERRYGAGPGGKKEFFGGDVITEGLYIGFKKNNKKSMHLYDKSQD